jgi:putative ABC transport system permease protein
MALMALSVAMGTAIAASLITVSLDIQGKVSRELRSFGANITVEPRVEGLADLAGQHRYLNEDDIIKVKTIFWRHNILGVAPFLEQQDMTLRTPAGPRQVTAVGTWFKKTLPLPGEKGTFDAGVEVVSPWWDIEGSAPGAGEVLLGVTLANELRARQGDTVKLGGRTFRVSGTLSTGGREDGQVFMGLEELQGLVGKPGAVSRVLVSALTRPMDDFAYKDPKSMTKPEYEKWYCTAYVTSISKQLEEVFRGSRARPIWHVAQTEGRVLDRLTLLVYLLTIASLLRRVDEIGLMKSLGADSLRVITIFLSEAFVIALIGGLAGYALSFVAAKFIGVQVFGAEITERSMLFPLSLGSALVISALGSLLPIRRALRVKPAVVLKEAR